MKRVVFFPIIILIAGVLMSMQSGQAAQTAAPVTLAWSPAIDSTVKGYAIYYGPTNQATPVRLDVGMANSATIFNMQANVTYRIYAVSYNVLGVESAPSDPVLVKQGTVARLRIGKQANGSMKLTFSAAPGAVGQVQYASRIGATWQNLGTTTTDANGNGTMTDNTVGLASSRFYRVAVP